MKTITDAVRSAFKEDEVAREAARRGILNSSAYAREIVQSVADQTWKDVEESSVTVSINRVIQESNWESVKPELVFEKMSVETSLVDVTFDRTLELREQLNIALPKVRNTFNYDLFIETTGQHQITMIMSQRMWDELKNNISYQPIAVFYDQVAIALSFDEKYLPIPNFIYAALGVFALDAINVTEIFSTLTEIVFVVASNDLDVALSRVKKYMK